MGRDWTLGFLAQLPGRLSCFLSVKTGKALSAPIAVRPIGLLASTLPRKKSRARDTQAAYPTKPNKLKGISAVGWL